jgi:hypothetical protein
MAKVLGKQKKETLDDQQENAMSFDLCRVVRAE